MKTNDTNNEIEDETERQLKLWKQSYSRYVFKFEGAADLDPFALSEQICKRHLKIIEILLTQVSGNDEMKVGMIAMATKLLAENDCYLACSISANVTKH